MARFAFDISRFVPIGELEVKVGILTFHSQLNYGGVLQCWALQTKLEKMGHEVAVVDRWPDENNSQLERGLDKFSFRQWGRFFVRVLFGLGGPAEFLRIRSTRRFLRDRLRLSPYHFVDWKDAPPDLGVDMLVVGSDQVWHCGDFGDPRVYLLEGAPEIPAIAYAASFGMTKIPRWVFDGHEDLAAEPIYRKGLARFKAISCREAEGVRLCETFGFKAEHVVDPTLLLDSGDWDPIVEPAEGLESKTPCLVCYFMSENVEESLPFIEKFAAAKKCRVKIFAEFGAGLLPFPSSRARFKKWVRGLFRRCFGGMAVDASVGPKEFLQGVANATWVVSDSFHALMFSTVFRKNVRMLKPQTDFRQKMFARIEEFAAHAHGRLVVDNLRQALESFGRGEMVSIDGQWLESRRRQSEDFLRRNVGQVVK